MTVARISAPLPSPLPSPCKGEGVRRSRSYEYVIILVIALLQFCLFLNHRDITNAHEGRTAETSREMLQRRDWIVPYCNGIPRLAKPPLMYWVTDLAWTIFHNEEPWAARLPVALCGALAVLLVMDLARRTLGRDAALCAGMIWVSTWFIVDEYRKAMADPYLSFFTLLAVWAWIAGDRSAGDRIAAAKNPAALRSAAAWRAPVLILIAYAAAALGALAKVHLIVIHLAIALIGYHVIRKSRPRMLGVHAVGAALFLIFACAWPLYIWLKLPNAWAIWRVDVLASEATSGSKFSPVTDYFYALPLTAAPWSVFALIGALMAVLGKRRREKRGRWALVWLAGTVVVFTLVPMKKNAYLLPAMPAQTLLAAAAMAAALRWPRCKAEAGVERFVVGAHVIGAIVTLGACLYLLFGLDRFPIEEPMPMVIGAVVAGSMLTAIGWLRPEFRRLRMIVGAAILFTLSVHIVTAWLVADFQNKYSDAPFAKLVLDRAGNDPLRVIGTGLREDVLFYLGGRAIPRIPTIDQVPADYKGFAIVTPEEYPDVSASNRGDELAASGDRRASNRFYLFSFPKSAEPPRDAR